MSASATAGKPPGHGGLARAGTIVAYSILGLTLLASRGIGLDHSFWTDEIMAVEDFVRAGPSEILTGPDLSHQLYGILAWLASTAVGESEVAYRLISVVPFIAGVILITAWLHVRSGRIAGVLVLFLATVSPLLLDITRQARGYGIAFLAMSVLVVGALEADRTGRTAAIVAACAGGVVGTMTLPQFGVAFVATGLVLVGSSALRARAVVALAASVALIGAWYLPHVGQVRAASQIEDGVRIDTLWLATAPIDQVLLPALLWIDGTALIAGVVWLPLVILAAIVMAASPLVHESASALILCTGIVATVVVLWLAQAYVIPRYLSYLLVPFLILLATGAAALLSDVRWGPRAVGAIATVVAVALLAMNFAALAPDVVRLPREANRDAAEAVIDGEPPPVVVLAYMRNPRNLEYYLERPTVVLEPEEIAERVCANSARVAYVTQPFGIPEVDIPCLARAGVEHRSFEQYARGREMNVWFVPPGPTP